MSGMNLFFINQQIHSTNHPPFTENVCPVRHLWPNGGTLPCPCRNHQSGMCGDMTFFGVLSANHLLKPRRAFYIFSFCCLSTMSSCTPYDTFLDQSCGQRRIFFTRGASLKVMSTKTSLISIVFTAQWSA